MAVPLNKFYNPPTFHVKDEEDGEDWLQRYEETASYNPWTDVDLLANFGRYVDGTCIKWFRCLVPRPVSWRDQDEVITNLITNTAHRSQLIGLRTLFQAAFRPFN